jgi:hypothetical protein
MLCWFAIVHQTWSTVWIQMKYFHPNMAENKHRRAEVAWSQCRVGRMKLRLLQTRFHCRPGCKTLHIIVRAAE